MAPKESPAPLSLRCLPGLIAGSSDEETGATVAASEWKLSSRGATSSDWLSPPRRPSSELVRAPLPSLFSAAPSCACSCMLRSRGGEPSAAAGELGNAGGPAEDLEEAARSFSLRSFSHAARTSAEARFRKDLVTSKPMVT